MQALSYGSDQKSISAANLTVIINDVAIAVYLYSCILGQYFSTNALLYVLVELCTVSCDINTNCQLLTSGTFTIQEYLSREILGERLSAIFLEEVLFKCCDWVRVLVNCWLTLI